MVSSIFSTSDKVDQELLQVIYTDEISTGHIVYCMAVFEQGNEYKLVAPWLGIGKIVQKSNTLDFQINHVPKDDINASLLG